MEDHTALTVINTLETLCTLVSALYFVKICRANAKLTAAKLLFAKESVEPYIFLFWMLRCFVLEILKGQVIYSFLLTLHSIVIYATDTWYLCNRKVLVFCSFVFINDCVRVFGTIFPMPTKPSWKFMNIETTANSLSLDQNYFNLFIIFFDAMVIVIYDVNRSKYVMMVKNRKREMLEYRLQKSVY